MNKNHIHISCNTGLMVRPKTFPKQFFFMQTFSLSLPISGTSNKIYTESDEIKEDGIQNLEINENYETDESNLLKTPLDRGPYFDLTASKNITALVGKTAYLNCRVKNLGNKTVCIKCPHILCVCMCCILESV